MTRERRTRRVRISDLASCDHSIPASSAICACGKYGRVEVAELAKPDPRADPVTGCLPVRAAEMG